MAWRLAMWPTSRSPLRAKATTEGVVRAPSPLGMTTGSLPSITLTQQLVVPRSIPITLDMAGSSLGTVRIVRRGGDAATRRPRGDSAAP